MSAPRRRVCTVLALAILLGGSTGSVWRLRAQDAVSSKRAQPAATRPQRPAVTNGDRGATYDWLEGKAIRATTRFADATVVAERGADGRVSTRVTDKVGNEVARLRVHPVDVVDHTFEFSLADGRATRMARRTGVKPTLDWSNQQAYSLWKDDGAITAPLEWQDTLVRPRGAKRRDVANDSIQTDTEWVGGFSATVTRKIGTHVSYQTGRPTTGLVFISAFKQDGVEVGSSQWWPQEQTFAWSFPGLTDGFVDASRLQRDGGWTFVPDMAWLNTQNLAFQQFHTSLNARGAVSQRKGSWLDRLGAIIAPTVFANEPGCDGLHWLDWSIFRPCCDSHDQCYAKADPACGANSWWRFWAGWECTNCNIYAAYCFVSGNGHVFHRFP
jgi:hypothetical protein